MADEKLLLIVPFLTLFFITYCIFFNEMNNVISKCCSLCKISKINRIIYPETNRVTITETEATILTIVIATPIIIINNNDE